MKYLSLLILLTTFTSFTSQCKEGCLICKDGITCLICDFMNGYYLNRDVCERDDIGKCKLYAANSENAMCLACFDGYYDIANGKCAEVLFQIPFCMEYQMEGVCSLCQPGYRIKQDLCEKVETKFLVDNCLVHSEDERLCDECTAEYILATNKESCVRDPGIRYCHHYSFLECQKCGDGTVEHLNSYFDKFKEMIDNNKIDELNSTIYDYLHAKIDRVLHRICVPANLPHCVEYETLSFCARCEDKYYVTPSGNCHPYPVEPVGHCMVYLDLKTCKLCREGFHVNKEGKCQENEIIEFCTAFSGDALVTTCMTCEDEYFLVGNKCFPRENHNVDNCGFYAISYDFCQECSSGYEVTSDKLGCLPEIVHCQDYIKSNKDTDKHTCEHCEDEFFLIGEECQRGLVDSCRAYMTNAEVCVRCTEEAYVSGNVCLPRGITIEDCAVYDANQEDKCETCDSNAIKFDLDKKCKPTNTIDFCSKFSNFETCSECEEKYELVNNKCNPIDASLNCLKKIGNNCNKCKVNFYLENGQCHKIPSPVLDNCMELEENPTEMNACKGCNEDNVPIKAEEEPLCIDPNTIDIDSITHCVKFKKDSNGDTCLKCENNKIVSSDGLSCLDNCPAGEVAVIGKVTFDNGGVSPVSAEAFMKCEAVNVTTNPELENCAIAAMATNKPGNPLACVKCVNNGIPTQTCPMEMTYFDETGTSTDDLLSAHAAVECSVAPNAIFGNNQSSTKDSNCLFYKLETVGGNAVFTCQACKFGKTGSISSLSPTVHHVSCSDNVEGCDSSVEFNGALLDNDWILEIFAFQIPYKYSCHKCTSDTEIPFIHLSFKSGLTPYALNHNPPSEASSKNGNLVECRVPNASGLGMTSTEFSNFPSNCALGFYSVDREKNSDLNIGTSVNCLACKNGFKPVKDANNFLIVSCQQIDFCDTSNDDEGWFNGCRTCQEGYSHNFNLTTKMIDYQDCQRHDILNCLAYDSTNNACAICKKGYTFNYNGVCESLTPTNCQNYNKLVQNSFSQTLDINHIDRALYFIFEEGCDACDNGYINVKYDEDLETCVASTYLTNGNFPDQNNKYIKNCSSHVLNNSGGFSCFKCEDSYLMVDGNKKCIYQYLFANCILANSNETSCVTCDPDYVRLTDGTCVPKTINLCKTWSKTDAVETCKECESGYILEGNTCQEGHINNCETFDSSTKFCTSCVEGFVLVVPNSIHQQCMPIPSDLQCATATLSADHTHLECLTCEPGTSFTSDPNDVNQNTCVNGAVIDNCAKYDIKNPIGKSTFQCLECESEYFIDEGECKPRTQLEGCSEFSISFDECAICEEDYVFNDNLVCTKLKLGINHCIEYTDDSTCTKCDKYSYLEDNECKTVAKDNIIQYCKEYTDATQCKECQNGSYLSNNDCIMTLASNCKTAENERNCRSCEDGWYLFVNNRTGNKNCEESRIANCAEFVKDMDECAVCAPHYYVNRSGSCTAVDKKIEHCEVYNKDNQKCEFCFEGYVLSANQTDCKFVHGIEMFNGCKRLMYRTSPRCLTCDPGHYFDKNVCIACTNQRYGEGCLYCDYKNNDNCLICRPGYWMSANGICLKNSQLDLRFSNSVKGEMRNGVGIVFTIIAILMLIK